jgi:hypothetical protein
VIPVGTAAWRGNVGGEVDWASKVEGQIDEEPDTASEPRATANSRVETWSSGFLKCDMRRVPMRDQ